MITKLVAGIDYLVPFLDVGYVFFWIPGLILAIFGYSSSSTTPSVAGKSTTCSASTRSIYPPIDEASGATCSSTKRCPP